MKTTLYWVIAVIITLAAAYYQRKTGPTHPKKFQATLNHTEYSFKLLTTWEGEEDFEVKIEIPDTMITGKVFYRRYPTNEEWKVKEFERSAENLVAHLPKQPAAGKLAYYLELITKDETIKIPQDPPVITRFKGEVPGYILLPHILIMFIAMLLSTLAGLLAFVKHYRYRLYGILTLLLIIIGGFILGPLMQYYAFGDAWTGIPFGWDLTDNKALIILIFWVVAVLANRKKDKPVYTMIAAIILLVIYSIPHSMFGSEFDYSTGEVTQGFINILAF